MLRAKSLGSTGRLRGEGRHSSLLGATCRPSSCIPKRCLDRVARDPGSFDRRAAEPFFFRTWTHPHLLGFESISEILRFPKIVNDVRYSTAATGKVLLSKTGACSIGESSPKWNS